MKWRRKLEKIKKELDRIDYFESINREIEIYERVKWVRVSIFPKLRKESTQRRLTDGRSF